jgi:hypothetical protein
VVDAQIATAEILFKEQKEVHDFVVYEAIEKEQTWQEVKMVF